MSYDARPGELYKRSRCLLHADRNDMSKQAVYICANVACHMSIPDSLKFCPHCSTVQNELRPCKNVQCRKSISPASKYCSECGFRQISSHDTGSEGIGSEIEATGIDETAACRKRKTADDAGGPEPIIKAHKTESEMKSQDSADSSNVNASLAQGNKVDNPVRAACPTGTADLIGAVHTIAISNLSVVEESTSVVNGTRIGAEECVYGLNNESGIKNIVSQLSQCQISGSKVLPDFNSTSGLGTAHTSAADNSTHEGDFVGIKNGNTSAPVHSSENEKAKSTDTANAGAGSHCETNSSSAIATSTGSGTKTNESDLWQTVVNSQDMGSSVHMNSTYASGQFYRKPAAPPEMPSVKRPNDSRSQWNEADRATKKEHDSSTVHQQYSSSESMAVKFHVLVPQTAWGWGPDTRLVIYFGIKGLGDWSKPFGEFTSRKLDEILWEMTSTILVPANLVENAKPIPYKYAVLNSELALEIESEFEFLYGAYGRGDVVNRCLVVPVKNCKSGGHHDQYDTIVYPELKSKNAFGKLVDFFKKRLGGSNWDDIPSNSTVRQKCLNVYLSDIQNMLKAGTVDANFSISKIVQHIMDVFSCLMVQRVYYDNHPDVWKEDELPKAFLKEWVLPIIEAFKDHCVVTSDDNSKRVLVGITLCCVLYKITDSTQLKLWNIPETDIANLLRMLCLMPDVASKKCLDYAQVRASLPESFVSECTDAISRLCASLMERQDVNSAEWLLCLPLIHLLRKEVEPFVPITYVVQDMPFLKSGSGLKLGSIRDKVTCRKGFFDKYFDKLKPLLQLDTLLQYTVAYVCPKEDFHHLIHQMSPYVCIGLIIKKLTESGEFLIEWLIQLIHHIMDVTIEIQSGHSFSEESMLDAAIKLLFALKRGKTENHQKLYQTTVAFIFHITLKIKNSSVDDNWQKIVTDTLKKIHQYFLDWINDINIGGGDKFGGELTDKAVEEELKLWKHLLNAPCPKEFTDQWQGIIKNIIELRVKNLKPVSRIDLLNITDGAKETPDLLLNAITEAAIDGLDKLTEQGYDSIKKLCTRSSSQMDRKNAERIGKVLTSLLCKKYPERKDSITVEQLLEWGLWPSYIKYYAELSSVQLVLPERCTVLCTCAHSVVEELWKRMHSGDVTLSELQKFEKKRQHIENLFSALATNQQDPKLSQHAVQSVLQQRFLEVKSICEYRNKLIHLCTTLPDSADFSELKKELDIDIDSRSIATLYILKDGKIFCSGFMSASPLNEMLSSFHILAQNDLFLQLWRKVIKDRLDRGENLSVEIVGCQIWPASYSYCQEFMAGLYERTLKLSDVDLYLSHYKAPGHLKKELLNLHELLCKCLGQWRDEKWIEAVVETVLSYWSLKQHEHKAATLLSLKEKLKLTGSFKDIETLAVKLNTSMGDHSRTLQFINKNLIESGIFMNAFTEERCRCLEVFVSCHDIVEWIQNETKDIADLKTFVTISLTKSADEGDYAIDKLSMLSTVATAYSSLIYELKPHASFEMLVSSCKQIWKSLKANPKLPVLLEECNRDVEWFKSVKATQGHVEITSFELVDNILQYGTYTIQAVQGCTSIQDAIQVHLDEREKRLPKKHFTLDELRDLESKLVLITGSRAENRKQVDNFLDTLHSIYHIADILLSLQHVGNVKYLEWKVTLPCSVPLVSELQSIAKDMEDDLRLWNEEVKKSREEYYELNYYTTTQLVQLRNEFGKMKANSAHSIDSKVIFLLRSISSEPFETLNEKVCNFFAKTSCDVIHHQNLTVTELHEKNSNFSANDAHCYISSQSEPKINSDQGENSVPMTKKNTNLNLNAEKLSEMQQEILTHLTSYLGYASELALCALEHCGDDKYVAELWCLKNMGARVEDFTDSDSEKDQSDDELKDQEMEQELLPTMNSGEGANVHLLPLKIAVTTKKPIDASHPAVKELMESGYSQNESILAVEKYDSNMEAALNYLISRNSFEPLNWSSRNETETVSATQVVVFCDPSVESATFLDLSELGSLLKALRPENVTTFNQRPFPVQLKTDSPNLLVTSPDDVLKTVLSLYMENQNLPLPSLEEVLICTEQTTEEEVTLLWMRAVRDPGFRRIFCLVHAEKMSYHVTDHALHMLDEITQGKSGYRIVIVCSNEGEEKSYIMSKLHLCQQQYTSKYQEASEYSEYLRGKFAEPSHSAVCHGMVLARDADQQRFSVRVVRSERSGMGKSLVIKRMAKKLETMKNSGPYIVTIPIHGPIVTADTVLQYLQKYTMDGFYSTIIHFDISPRVLRQIDTILFSLLVLRGLADSYGSVWRCHPSQLCAVEITVPSNKVTDGYEKCLFSLLDLLPTINCISPNVALQLTVTGQKSQCTNLVDEEEFCSSSFQRVFQYLKKNEMRHNLDTFRYTGNVEGDPADCLRTILKFCGMQNPTWLEIKHFVSFLDIQLKSCEESIFCDEVKMGDILKGLKSFVVKFMIQMSRDFATPSLQGEYNPSQENADNDILKEYQIDQRRQWEKCPHPYIFFNQDCHSITFVGFKINKGNGDLINPVNSSIVERAIITPQLVSDLEVNGVNFSEDYSISSQKKDFLLDKLTKVMGLKCIHDPDVSYVLTPDNLIKMLAIQMRFRCSIPVVIMGETGCGKTRLIRYMCDLAAQGSGCTNMFMLKVHGGTTQSDVINVVKKAQAVSVENRRHHLDTVLFFDEANTSDAVGLIKEIMCDHRMNGEPISQDIKFIAACNPYRKHTDKMIEKLESAGLGFYVKSTETHDKLGKIPLRQLVYRVLDLPLSLQPLVYDFGQLSLKNEKEYIQQIVTNHFREGGSHIISVSSILMWSQAYMRRREDECSFVSLRDVERCMIVFKYFLKGKDLFCELIEDKAKSEGKTPADHVTRSLILALSVCYGARLQDKADYENGVSTQFVAPLALCGRSEQFRSEIRWCQEVLLDGMDLGQNIARNGALRENVFMMVVCIELRIPLFVVGKPGSSKSLAKSIVSLSMAGKVSKHPLLRRFKEVHMFSYQCSQLSTSESVIEVFATAKQFQQNKSVDEFVSVVVLDEVGLAEDSPNLPLKALHPLLEDGTEGADDTQQYIAQEERVAFIGISNWALDPAKMNRGVMLMRGDPSSEELILSARGICSNQENDIIRESLEGHFSPLAKAYWEISQKQKKDFFGLRDFYSLIKMLYWMRQKSKRELNWRSLEHAIRRNFGGLDEFDPIEVFRKHIALPENVDDSIPEELLDIVSPGCSQLDLITASLKTREKTWHGENRYLLFLTENYAALQILRHYLKDVLSTSPGSSRNEEHSGTFNHGHMEPFVLFGSSFPKDKEYTQVCRNINQIKICMETGRTVILLNLESLYESLYDLLNQYYITSGKSENRYVDLGLQTHKVKCRVHDNFKLILIAEKATVYEKFPIPLINRLEKHFVLTKSILTEWQKSTLSIFKDWIDQFCDIEDPNRNQKFQMQDAFVGYQNDTPAAIVFQASNDMKNLQIMLKSGLKKGDTILSLASISNDTYIAQNEGSDIWQQAVLMQCKWLLLQTASPDAIIRLKNSHSLHTEVELLNDIYLKHQRHSSLLDLLDYKLNSCEQGETLLMQVSTNGPLLTTAEVADISQSLKIPESHVHCFLLQEFDTELDFCNKISLSFSRQQNDVHNVLLIIQCEAGHLYGDLVACARYRILDEITKAFTMKYQKGGATHVLFIIQLPSHTSGSSFVGFQGNPWTSVHIDELHPESGLLTLNDALKHRISELFVPTVCADGGDSVNEHDIEMDDSDHSIQCDEMEPMPDITPQYKRLYTYIHAAAAKLSNTCTNKKRAIERISILHALVPKNRAVSSDADTFYDALVNHIHKILQKRDDITEYDSDWVLNEALNCRKIQQSGTFRNLLTRRLDEVVVPIFAKVISFVDQYCNLNLISGTDKNGVIYQFWLRIFGNPNIVLFNYEDMVIGSNSGVSSIEIASGDFKCKMPFFWIIKETVDGIQWSISQYRGKSTNEALKELRALVSETPLGEILDSVEEVDCDHLFNCYLEDYVRCVHRCYHKEEKLSMQETNLVSNALRQLINGVHYCSIDGNRPLTDRICSVHFVYEIHKTELMCFGQLTQHIPSILHKIQPTSSSDKMVLHLQAAEEALNQLAAPIGQDESTMKAWLRHVQQCKNALDTILLLPTTPSSFSRQRWYLIYVLKLFMEHIVLRHEGTVCHARRLHLYLKSHVDFCEVDSVEKVKSVLNAMVYELKEGQLKGKAQKLKALKKDCNAFFVEVVSALCFGYGTPEDKLIKMLIDIVFEEQVDTKRIATKELTYGDVKADAVPKIRSFLLNLLVSHQCEMVRHHLTSYIHKSRRAFSDPSLYLLCIQCFEDSAFKHKNQQEFSDNYLAEMLHSAHKDICNREEPHTDVLSLPYLEAVALVRFGLSVIAEVLHSQVTSDKEQIIAPQSLQRARDLCLDKRVNTCNYSFCTGPAIFLVRILIRQYGVTTLDRVIINNPWVLPEIFQNRFQTKSVDPFIIYGSKYLKIRGAMYGAIYGNLFSELSTAAVALTGCDTSLLLLSVFEVATLSKASTEPSKQILPEVTSEISLCLKECQQLNIESNCCLQALLINQQGGILAHLQVTPQQTPQERALATLVVHAATVFVTRKDDDLLIPFFCMQNDPAALLTAYLPTMPEDHLPEVAKAVSGKFYQCPQGHRYLVTECGEPMQIHTCFCGETIGGIEHKLLATNAYAKSSDETGHILGSPEGRSNTHSERSLSPVAVCIMRALMHAALLWASCNNQNASAGLVQLIKPALKEQEIPEFLWMHLEKDVTLLGKALGRSVDEAVLVIHLVLQQILEKDVPKSGTVQGGGALAEKASRGNWEALVNQSYIEPVLKELNQMVTAALDAILKDQSIEQDHMFFSVYEKAQVQDDNIEEHLWIYRQRICLSHIHQIIVTNNLHRAHPLLYLFLQEESNLRATQYLPDIVQLQQYLFHKWNGQLDRNDGRATIADLINREKVKNTQIQLQRKVQSLSKAWEIVQERLPEHARLRVDRKYLIPSISLETKLDYLIPTTTGPGVCTTSLVDFLVCTHNDFVEKCCEMSAIKWMMQKVPLTQISSCHVIDYERQLLPIIMSHCQYSLEYGKGQNVEYDFSALEKHILDSFIFGKPHLMLEIPNVVFKSERYTAAMFRSIRQKIPQENLSSQLQKQVINELKSIHKLNEAMDAIKIILIFVSSGGGKAEKNLGEYAEKALKMNKEFSQVAKKYCKLKHIISLWQTTAVESARQLSLKGIEPFDELAGTFHNALTQEQRSDLYRVLRSYDIEILLGLLFEFIETSLRHSELSMLEWNLGDTLEAFVERYGVSITPKYFNDLKPIGLLNNQAVSVWRHIVEYQDEKLKGK